MQSEPASHIEIVELLGEVDDLLVERIIDTHATVAEVAEALDAIEDDRQFGEQYHVPSSARVTEVQVILADLMTEDDDDSAPFVEDSTSGR